MGQNWTVLVEPRTFPLDMFFRLDKYCAAILKRWGCPKSKECGHDIVEDTLVIGQPGPGSHITVSERGIVVDLKGARDQKKVLNKALRNKAVDKWRRCIDCKIKFCPISEGFPDDTSERRTSFEVPIDPQTPEDVLRSKQLFEQLHEIINNPEQEEAFIEHALHNYSHAKIANRKGIKAPQVRQWFRRNRKALAKSFLRVSTRVRSRKKDRQTDNEPAEFQLLRKQSPQPGRKAHVQKRKASNLTNRERRLKWPQ